MNTTFATARFVPGWVTMMLLGISLLFGNSIGVQAADPPEGTLSPDLGERVDWVGTAPGGVNPGPQFEAHDDFCVDGVNCEFFLLDLTGVAADWDNIQVRVFLRWESVTTDYDVYVHAGSPTGPIVTDSASGPTNFERFEIDPLTDGTGLFYIHVVYFAATAADQYSGSATVVSKSGGVQAAPIDSGIPPRYQTHTPTEAQIAAGMTRNSQDEPNIGVNWESETVMLQALLQTLRVDFNDLACPQTPESTWEDVSPPTAVNSFDPILFTDHETNRTFVSHLLLNPLASLTSFTDDDGDLWIPSQGAGAGSGIDHQTIGGGPFADPVPPGAVYPNAVYYCAQDIAFANCALSLDGGITFGPAIPMYHLLQCAGLHGHVKVGPDGTVYVPNAECVGEVNPNENGVAVSEDNGLTWEVRTVPETVGAGGSDPSVAIAEDGTVYLGFVDDDKFPAVAVSHDRGQTWTNVYDVGSMVGVVNAVFPAMVAGDPDRAAMAFYGTTSSGNLNEFHSQGEWYLFVAHTYDGGDSWVTVNATPNDPLQRGGIHLGGGGSVHRNLLDFFDADYDPQGRMVVGYADGCTGACVPTADGSRGNSYTAWGKIARQSGGRRLIAEHDPVEPTVPGAPFLTAWRNGDVTTLAISQSEDGASPVISYDVFRAAEGGPEQHIATLNGAMSVFVDPTATGDIDYSYRVVANNALGASCGTNAVTSRFAGASCALPGIRLSTDSSGDQTTAPLDPDMDIEWISIAEPEFPGSEEKLVFTLKVADLSTLPPERMWRVLWDYPDEGTPGSATGAFAGTYYIGMDTDSAGAVSFPYGLVEDLSLVVLGVAPPEQLGEADPESTFAADGTITLVISKDKVGSPGAGDIIGGLIARTYPVRQDETLRSNLAVDSAPFGDSYQLSGNAACVGPPSTQCFEDDASEIAYGNGWHSVEHGSASGGQFTFKPGKSPNSGVAFEFEVAAGDEGALEYHYARSGNGGTADVYIDGVFQETIDYQGGTNKMQDPEFGFSARYENLAPGIHVFELRNVDGPVYLDKLCVESATSSAAPANGPGETTTSLNVIGALETLTENLSVPDSADAVAVVASADEDSSFRLLLLDPSGAVLHTVESAGGVAVIEQSVSQFGLYHVNVVNLSLSPVEVWTAATPWVGR